MQIADLAITIFTIAAISLLRTLHMRSCIPEGWQLLHVHSARCASAYGNITCQCLRSTNSISGSNMNADGMIEGGCRVQNTVMAPTWVCVHRYRVRLDSCLDDCVWNHGDTGGVLDD